MIVYETTKSAQDLEQILELQRANHPENLTEEEVKVQGFVSAKHDAHLLREMSAPYSHVVARGSAKGMEDKVVGYCLTMLPEFDGSLIPCLDGNLDMKAIDSGIEMAQYKGKPVRDLKYLITGQVCVAKEFRGQGVFSGLYHEMRRQLSPHFDCMVAPIAVQNKRSLYAHTKIGFQVVHEYTIDSGEAGCGDEWCVVLWDWSGDS